MPSISLTLSLRGQLLSSGPIDAASLVLPATFDYAAGTYEGSTFAAEHSFSRASTGTYFTSAGLLASAAVDTARFDYNPATLAARGLLIEGAATNLLLQSSTFNNASWLKSAGAAVTADVATGIDGTASADRLTSTGTGTGTPFLYQSVSMGVGTYVLSVVAKAEVGNAVRGIALRTHNVAGVVNGSDAFFSLDGGGAVGTINPAYSAASVRDIGNGFVECNLTFVCTGASSAQIRIYMATAAESTTITLGGADSVLLGAAGLQVAPLTSHIPTTSTSVTRAADTIAVTTNFGTCDVRITYDDDSTADLLAQAVTGSWWPTLARPRVKSILFAAEGTLP